MSKIKDLFLGTKVPAKEREYFVTNLAIMLNSSVTVGQALESLHESSSSYAMRRSLSIIMQKIDNGESLAQALRKSGLVSPQTLALIALGEKSGNLGANLKLAATQEEKLRILKSKVRSALMYPIFVLGTTLTIGLAVAWFLLPKLSETFDDLGMELPLVSQVMINIGLFLREDGYWAVPLAFAVSGLILYLLFLDPIFKRLGQRILLRTPIIRRVIMEVELVRFGYILGTLLNAGLTIIQSLRLLQNATGLYRYKKLYLKMADQIEEGYGISTALKNNSFAKRSFPPTVRQMISTGETSGALADTLTEVGRVYEEKADSSARNLEAAIEPILLIIVWLGVLGVAVAVILPIYSLVGGIDG